MLDSLGARLRQQRERQGISLATISHQTKIKQSLLEGLERDEVSHWPGGLFRRAYVRAYAHAINLDPEIVVREFVQCYPDPSEEVAPLSKIAETTERERSAPPTRFGFLLRSAIRSIPGRSRDTGAEDRPSIAPARLPTFDERDAPVEVDVELAADVTMVEDLTMAADVTIAEEPAAAPNQATPPPEESPGIAVNAQPELSAVASLCTAFGRAATPEDLVSLMGESSRFLDATGLIIWVWDSAACRLRPELAYGYSDRVLAQIPALERDAPNATAAAFRLEQPCTVEGRDARSGALVVPIMTPAGCAGVLTIELRGSTPGTWTPALATIFASQLSRWLEPEIDVQAADRLLA